MQFKSGEVCEITELTPKMMEQIAKPSLSSDGSGDIQFRYHNDCVVFEPDKLAVMSLKTCDNFKIDRSPNGPFLELPWTKEQLVAKLGEPVRYQ